MPTPMVSRGRFSLKIWMRNYWKSARDLPSALIPGDWVSMTYTGSSGSSEDETTEVGSALVAQGTSGVDESADTVALESRADKGGAPGDGGRGRLLGLDELLLGVGELGALVGLAEDGAQDRKLDAVVEEGAQRDGRGLDGRKVWRWCRSLSANLFSQYPSYLPLQPIDNGAHCSASHPGPYLSGGGAAAGEKPAVGLAIGAGVHLQCRDMMGFGELRISSS